MRTSATSRDKQLLQSNCTIGTPHSHGKEQTLGLWVVIDGFHGFSCGSSSGHPANIQEISRFTPIGMDDVHRCHRQSSPIDHAGNVPVQCNVVQAMLPQLGLFGILWQPQESCRLGPGERVARWASIGQVWTRHLAPAAPASRPSSPSQFHDCPCHADSALQFVPSLVPGWGKSRAASTGFRALSPSD